jgi:hypothetical protein
VAIGFLLPVKRIAPLQLLALLQCRTEVEAYDPSTGDWTSLAPIPQVALGPMLLLCRPQGRLPCAPAVLPCQVCSMWAVTPEKSDACTATPCQQLTCCPNLQARGDNALVQLPGDRMMVMGGETNTQTRTQVTSAGP